MSNLNVTNIQHESGAGDNLILAADGTTTIPGGTNRPKIVGYQQGIWLPDFGGQDNSGSLWISYGLPPLASLVSEFSATWYRIGQQVTVRAFIYFTGTATTAADNKYIAWKGLPYLASNSIANIIPPEDVGNRNAYVGHSYFNIYNPNVVNDIVETQSQIYADNPDPDVVNIVKMSPGNNASYMPVGNCAADGQSVYHMIDFTYRTDDTTWVPQPGRTAGVS